MSESNVYHVKPADLVNGANVRKENGELLKAEGEAVPRNSFWRRRIDQLDVVEFDPANKAKK